MLDRLHDQLRDAFAPRDEEWLRRVVIDETDLELAPVARVDEAGRVETGNTVFECEAAAGLHESGVALRQRNRDSRWDQRPPTGRRQSDVFSGDEVDTGVAGPCVRRKRQVGVETKNREIEHNAKVADRAL